MNAPDSAISFCACTISAARLAGSSSAPASALTRSNSGEFQRDQFHAPIWLEVNHCVLKFGSSLPLNRISTRSTSCPASPLPTDQ